MPGGGKLGSAAPISATAGREVLLVLPAVLVRRSVAEVEASTSEDGMLPELERRWPGVSTAAAGSDSQQTHQPTTLCCESSQGLGDSAAAHHTELGVDCNALE